MRNLLTKGFCSKVPTIYHDYTLACYYHVHIHVHYLNYVEQMSYNADIFDRNSCEISGKGSEFTPCSIWGLGWRGRKGHVMFSLQSVNSFSILQFFAIQLR